ncbi:DUF4259 domain-containing protein [Streptomyces sp. PA03-1a]|nr:DUF4259 domain-containing protein [Streptomyces sp. PA03-1a]MDX2814020.1 DUF4259 domain-containing protein [Streptomyces sp. PA03-5A]
MGGWGSGNFDEDTAADHLSVLTGRLVREVEDAVAGAPGALEPDEYWGVAVPCNVELLHLIATQGWAGVVLPAAATVRQWKAAFLAAWDGAIDDLAPSPEHRAGRRAVLVRTFDALAELAERRT